MLFIDWLKNLKSILKILILVKNGEMKDIGIKNVNV